jgi:hypothetical protein
METEPAPENVWAETIKPGWQEVPVERRFVSKSGPNLCSESTDEGRHHWYINAVCSQSIEQLECGFCKAVVYD